MNDTQIQRPRFLYFPLREQISFTKRLGMILKAGISITEGLSMIREGARTTSARYVFQSLAHQVESGQTLASSLYRVGGVFNDFCINIVRVGEASGSLDENLLYISEELQKKQALKKKIVGALTYPAVIVVATIGISLALTLYIFPKITPIFQGFKQQLPLSTRVLMATSRGLQTHGLAILVVCAVCIIVSRVLIRYTKIHRVADQLLLSTQLLGKLSRFYNCATIARTVSLLIKSGVPLVDALGIASHNAQNLLYRDVLHTVSEDAARGLAISTSFSQRHILFPPFFSQMVSVGERTGNLSGALSHLATIYEEEITDLTKTLTTLLEPILMLFMGIIVGFIAISIITPIYGITQNLNSFH